MQNTMIMKMMLADIISHRCRLQSEEILSLQEESLLGPKIRMPARELLHVFFDVEKSFEIRISESDIAKGRFKSFTDIWTIIEEEHMDCKRKKGIS